MAKSPFTFHALWGLIIAILLTEVGWAQLRAVAVKASDHVLAPPLAEAAPISAASERSSPEPDDDLLLMHERRAISAALDTALQPASANLIPSLSAGLNILGQGTGFPNYKVNTNTSDPNAAVGATQVVQFVNDSFAVFNKSTGKLVSGPVKGNTLWQPLGGPCAAAPNLDEIVQYDKLANRWIMMMPVFTSPNYFCFAVSTTSDAVTGSWNLYAFPEPGNPICNCRMQPDYPKLGVWPDGYYMSYNQGWNGNFVGPAACVVDRNRMLQGKSATMQCFNTINAKFGTMVPSDLDGSTPPPAGAAAYFMNFDYGTLHSLDIWRFHVNWSTPANSGFTGPTVIAVAPFTEACGETATELNYVTGACIPQAGTAQTLDSYGDRLMYRLAYRNLGTHESLVTNHTVTTGLNGAHTGIRWYEVQKTSSGFKLFQQGTYAPNLNYRWMGSIAMDKNSDMALGYSVSGPNMSPSIGYTGRLFSDPLGEMQGEVDALAAAGVARGSRTNNFRWSDYSSIAIDPTDDCTFWYTAEYMPANGGNWSTRLVSFRFPSCQ